MGGGKKRGQQRRQRAMRQRDKRRNLRTQCHESQGQDRKEWVVDGIKFILEVKEAN